MLAGAATWLVHRETLHYGFDYDDYHFLRPYSLAEVLATFHGPWDLTGIEVKFYRPLTIVLYATRFELFGLNATAHHAVSLTLFALAAALTAWLIHRLTARATAAVSPPCSSSAIPPCPTRSSRGSRTRCTWPRRSSCWRHSCGGTPCARARSVWWLPLLFFGVAAFMVKEDGLMLLPAIVTLHASRAAWPSLACDPCPGPSSAWPACSSWRSSRGASSALGELGGYGRPTAHAAWINLTRGLTGVFRLVPADRPWQGVASWFATLLPLVAIASGAGSRAASRVCLLGWRGRRVPLQPAVRVRQQA